MTILGRLEFDTLANATVFTKELMEHDLALRTALAAAEARIERAIDVYGAGQPLDVEESVAERMANALRGEP